MRIGSREAVIGAEKRKVNAELEKEFTKWAEKEKDIIHYVQQFDLTVSFALLRICIFDGLLISFGPSPSVVLVSDNLH